MISRATGLAIAVTVAIVALFIMISQCSEIRNRPAQGRVDKGQAEAAVSSGSVALETISDIAEKNAVLDAYAKEKIDEIRALPEAERDLAALRTACQLRAYVGTRRCTELRAADTADAKGANAGH